MDALIPILALVFGFGIGLFMMVYLLRTMRDAVSPRHGLAAKYWVALWNDLDIETNRHVNSAGDIILTCFKDTVDVISPRLSEIQRVTEDKPILDDFEGHAQLTFVNTPTGKRKEAPQNTKIPAILRPTTG